ncbi:GTP-binding protein [Streptomyces sp. NPDC051219]|uniref:CobW family GTP-binding protein n=1 Tax=Streptomyces sp. NPDC051219 TaxID=3155283 RepID=UPI0034233437
MSRTPIPVVVLAGFLGSGKTTLLNHLLSRRGGNRIGAIVNDFGAIEIDAMTLAGQAGSTVSLGNGCMCCAVDGSELDVYLEKLTSPSARLDVIVIEASGLAEPQELVRMILGSENPHVMYGGLVQVVDAVEFDATRQRHPEIDRHLGIADLVVLNKTERASGPDLTRLHEVVGQLSPGTPVIPASYGRIDPELLFECKPRAEVVGQLSFEDLHDHHEDPDHDGEPGHGGPPVHVHSAYESVDFVSPQPMNPRRLMDFLDTRPDGLYRIKGFVDFGAADPRNRYGLHAVGRFLRFTPQPWPQAEQPITQLVLIGAGVDADDLRTALDACRETRPPQDAADERNMWGVLRFVQQ